jgi:hypothetical protein
MSHPDSADGPAQPTHFGLMLDARWAAENSLVLSVLPEHPGDCVSAAIEHAWLTLRSAGFALERETAPAALRALDALIGSVLWKHSAFAAEIEATLGAGDDGLLLAGNARSIPAEERQWAARLEDAYDLVHGSSRPFANRLAGVHRVTEGMFQEYRAAPWLNVTVDAIADSVRTLLASCATDAPPPTLRWLLRGWMDVMAGDLDSTFATNVWRLLRRSSDGREMLLVPTLALAAAIVLRVAYAGLVECVFEETDDRSVAMWTEDWWHPCMGSKAPSAAWAEERAVWVSIDGVLPRFTAAIRGACTESGVPLQTLLLDPFGTRAILSGHPISPEEERFEDELALECLHLGAFNSYAEELLISRFPLVE